MIKMTPVSVTEQQRFPRHRERGGGGGGGTDRPRLIVPSASATGRGELNQSGGVKPFHLGGGRRLSAASMSYKLPPPVEQASNDAVTKCQTHTHATAGHS